MARPKIRMEDLSEMLNFEVEDVQKKEHENTVAELELSKMEAFPEHKFKLYEGKRFDDMVESIREFGILMPIILWKKEEHYIILSGHNRVNCGKVAGLIKAPVIMKENLSYDEAVLITIETNLCQRSFSRDGLVEEYNLSKDKLSKYIRIGEYMKEEQMELFDKKYFSLSTAYLLSFIVKEEQQNLIANVLTEKNYKIDGKKAEFLRQYYENGTLTKERIEQILSSEKTRKPPSSKVQPVKIKATIVSKYFSREQSQKEIEEVIDKALALYFAEEHEENENTGS